MALCKLARCQSLKIIFSQVRISSLVTQVPVRFVHSESQNKIEVYSGPLSRQIRSVKIFSLLSSLAGVCAQPVILERCAEIQASSVAIYSTCGIVGFFTFVTPFLLHYVTKKYVTNVIYDTSNDSYTATVYTLFLRKKKIDFKPGEATVPDIPGMFTSMTVRGIPLFIDVRFFPDVFHYQKIMGYDKPMDFKLKET